MNFFRFFYQQPIILALFGLSFLFLLLGLVFILVTIKDPLSPNIILHFDVYKGIDFLGSADKLYEILISGFLVVFINMVLVRAMFHVEPFFSYILCSVSALSSLLIFVSIAVIIGLN